MSRRRTARLLPLLAAAALGGCAQLDYYTHLARGQLQLLARREPIADIVADSSRDPQLRERLALVQQARRYASSALGLSDNGSYTGYVDLQRDYVAWNVFATPEFSLSAHESCFPIAGCLAYRGFYERRRAEAYADELAAHGLETHIGGVPAYSTLGWFDDPVINTMMRWSDAQLIGTLFHELAHQQLYVKHDTAFNESFASFVEEQGLRDYAAASGLDSRAEAEREARSRDFVRLILAARERLAALYVQPLRPEAMRVRKAAEIERLRADYRSLRDQHWGGYAGYDGWFAQPINNARLLPFGLYDRWVPAFSALWQQQSGNWKAFYAAAKELGALPPTLREQRLRGLAPDSAGP